ncbi:MAG: hypothetical protein JXA94_04875 [Parachlamydiales bacterium]|nr:hypothetical protein [Parachlamydiales bacterium]
MALFGIGRHNPPVPDPQAIERQRQHEQVIAQKKVTSVALTIIGIVASTLLLPPPLAFFSIFTIIVLEAAYLSSVHRTFEDHIEIVPPPPRRFFGWSYWPFYRHTPIYVAHHHHHLPQQRPVIANPPRKYFSFFYSSPSSPSRVEVGSGRSTPPRMPSYSAPTFTAPPRPSRVEVGSGRSTPPRMPSYSAPRISFPSTPSFAAAPRPIQFPTATRVGVGSRR